MMGMEGLHLKQIEIEGFKSIRKADIALENLNVLIGANGAGKSNFIKMFEFIRHLIERNLQTYVARKGGADGFLYFGSKTTEKLRLKLDFGAYQYQVVLTPTVNDTFIFLEEYWNGPDMNSKTQSALGNYTESALSLASVMKDEYLQPTLANILKLLESCRVYHFHDTSDTAKIKLTGDLNDNQSLRADGSNLAGFLYLLRERYSPHYDRIVKTIRLAAPFFDDFTLRPNPLNPDKIRLEWREVGTDVYFDATSLSDGTLRFMALTTLLMQPELPSTILIDEPELGLNPYAIVLLAGLLESAATQAQVIVSSQSTTLVNQLAPENIIVVEREDGQSVFKRQSSGSLDQWLEDYGMGDLWEKNVIGGRPRP